MLSNNFHYRFFFHKSTYQKAGKAYLILFIGLVLTLLTGLYTKHEVDEGSKSEFSLICNEIQTKIYIRLHAHAQLLRNGSAFFAASESVSRKEWKTFYSRSNMNKNLPGIQGFGFSLIVPKSELSQHIQNIRNEGFPDYIVKPLGNRDIYTSIIYLEPFEGRNLRAFGYDMFSEPIRREAMEKSRDSNLAMLSGKVILVQEANEDLQIGTLMYVPVYKNGMPINTPEQRRKAIKGWVYNPYRMNDLMNGILGRWDANNDSRIHLQIYDNNNTTPNSLLFDSQHKDKVNDDFSLSRILDLPIVFNGKMWTLRFYQSEKQFPFLENNVLIVSISGVVMSFLFFALYISLLNTKNRAKQIADELTSELIDSEEKYRVVFNNEIYAICIFDLETLKLLDVNKAYENVYGYTREELLSGMTIHDITAEHQLSDAATVKATREGTTFIPLRYHRKKDGTVFPVEIVGGPYLWKNRNVMFALAHDISDRKQAEEELAIEKQRLDAILKGTNVGTWEWNIQTGETIFNERWAEIIGYTLEEISPTNIETWMKYTHPEDLEISSGLLKKHFNGNLSYYACEVRMKHKNGAWVYILDRGRVNKWDESGKPLIMSGTHQDITLRKLAEQSLLTTTDELRSVMESTKDVIAMMNCDFRYTLFNSAFHEECKRIFGIEFKPGDSMVEALANLPVDLEEALKYWKRALAGEDFIVTQQFGDTNLERNWYELHFSPIIDHEGKVISAVHIVRNITDRKNIEMEIQKKNIELAELNSSKDKFFSIIAHDLKSPFSGFLGLTKILAEQIDDLTMREMQEISKSMQISATNLYSLLENLLEWSRMQRGKVDYNPEISLLSFLVKQNIDIITDRAKQKDIVIISNIDDDLEIFADIPMFNSVLRNLISNAVKFTPKGGKIEIGAGINTTEDLVLLNNYIQIYVRDTGIGMSTDILNNLFRIDQNISRTGTDGEPSTGLGLLLCKEFIEKHGGRIWAESEVGNGSTFFFTLPKG